MPTTTIGQYWNCG